MPQEFPAWKDYARQLRLIRESSLDNTANLSASIRGSKDQLYALFESADVAGDKAGRGVLSFSEANRGLIEELRHRTRLKHSDKLVIDSVSEAIRRGFLATRSIKDDGGRDDSLDFDEFDDMLLYLERFFELLDMFKVFELEKGKCARVKSGGDERPIALGTKDFALALPVIRAWGVVVEGKPSDIFMEVTQGAPKIGFDVFAHWALKMSVGCTPPALTGT